MSLPRPQLVPSLSGTSNPELESQASSEFTGAPFSSSASTPWTSYSGKPSFGNHQSPSQVSLGGDSYSSSIQSLRGERSSHDLRRTLLVVYIHGYNGSDTTFQKFPVHVHNLLSIALVETHTVHSKIYPRYKSQKAVELVAEEFSRWISPHESIETDLVLVGHSLGGILAAEITVLPSSPGSLEIFRHRVLGILNLDVPFLGLHPGVIPTGLGSLFQPKTKPEKAESNNSNAVADDVLSGSESSDGYLSPFDPSLHDPNFNPAFPNDIRLKKRSRLDAALHFLQKNSNDLRGAAKRYVTSRFEFASCVSDYPGLKRRYRKLQELEGVDEYLQKRDEQGRPLRRVRFINYYTAATGRIKPTTVEEDMDSKPLSASAEDLTITDTRGHTLDPGASDARSISAGPLILDTTGQADYDDHAEISIQADTTKPDLEESPGLKIDSHYDFDTSKGEITLPMTETKPIPPPLPYRPLPPALSKNQPAKRSSQDSPDDGNETRGRKGKHIVPTDQPPLSGQDALLTEPLEASHKLISRAPSSPTPSSSPSPLSSPQLPPTTLISSQSRSPTRGSSSSPSVQPKSKKYRMFCALPRGSSDGREIDPLWVRVYMEDMDEVTAHQSLFLPNESYEKLVGDVVARIEMWVQDELSIKAVLASMGEGELGDEGGYS
ncbi:hypothetical protein AJ80_05371 [Polytolypa hystricis UAMH7299]|uniref:DUF676 domain-containing protein n=1 Tax=Polytolypa hystricis (strain UAMH7299) TaxID=1447883 RepID=A0A2B7Y454_POLH7|nr:hypothetical protein AJ80_05371 [Polytolypa hystricis UAMH7299]